MSSTGTATLADRKNEFTRRFVLDAAVQLLERSTPLAEVTFLAVAKRANISQRTLFRYFRTRDDFLDALAEEIRTRLAPPPPPRTLEELANAPRLLYEACEARRRLVVAGLQPELLRRMVDAQAKARWAAIRKLVDAHAPKRTARERAIAAANIRYYLGASTWHYFRFYLGLDLTDTIACAETAIAQSLGGLAIRLPGRGP
jgi:AcrR family transcriptional regulator